MCNQGFHFASELQKHKVLHQKTPTCQCMHANCGCRFFRRVDLTFHVTTHAKKEWSCDICKKFTTTSKKYLKDHPPPKP